MGGRDCEEFGGHTPRRTDRKKRRGVIEKKRRDRINGSLCDLKRLVPSALDKQGSTKLEKAEILQMTVDHIKLLNAKGVSGYGVEASALALDYRTVGFRECVGEVARYLAAVEGLDIQDPLRMRLLGHLEAYSAQRELTAKANVQTFNSWGSTWSRLHNNNTNTLSPSKYCYGLSPKSGLNQLGLFNSNNHQQSANVDSAYLAASRLGSAMTFTSPSSHMPTPFCSRTQSQQTAACHYSEVNNSYNGTSIH